MISRRIVINVVFFFILSAGLIAGLVIAIFNLTPKYSVYATFDNTGGAFTGQEVTYRGVTVGRIGTLEVVQDGVRMELVIEREFDEIPADARAQVLFKSAVGEQFVDLLPQTSSPPFLEHGSEIPKERTELPVQQEDLLRLLAQVLDGVPPEAIASLVDTLGEGLGGRGDALHLALAALDPISGTLANRVTELNRLNRNADTVGTAFDATRSEFEQGVDHLATVSEVLGSSAGDLERLFEEGSSSVGVVADLVAARKAQINDIIADLSQVTRASFDNFESLKSVINLLEAFLGTFIDAFDEQTGRFRFGQVQGVFANPPCDYVFAEGENEGEPVPRRSPDDRSGDAPYHPVLHFRCLGAGATSSGGTVEAASVSSIDTADPPPGEELAEAVPVGHWLRILTDTLRP